MEDCPQSWKLGHTFLDKTASHQLHLLSNLSMVFPIERETHHWNAEDGRAYQAGLFMVAPEVQGIDLLRPCGVQNRGPLHFRMGSELQNGYGHQTAVL